MMHLNPLVLVGAVIGVITALLVAAYAAVKDKKTAMGFERNMEDGEIMRRLARYARPYLSKFLIVGVLMLFSIAYDIISPLRRAPPTAAPTSSRSWWPGSLNSAPSSWACQCMQACWCSLWAAPTCRP